MTNATLATERDRFASFCNWLRARGRKEATLTSYASAHRNLFEGQMAAASSLSELTSYDLAHWKSRALGRFARPAAINHRLGFLRLYVRWATLQGHLTPERASLLQAVPDVPITRLGVKTLGDAEFRRFMAAVETQGTVRDRALVFLLLSGLRVSEACGLQRHDVNLNAHRGHVEIRGEHVKFTAARQVPLGRKARFHLTRHLESRPLSGPIFRGERGPLTVDGAYKAIRRLGELAGLEVHPHILRHQFARLWLAANQNDLAGLQAILGHANVQTTARHYCRKSLSDLAAGTDAILL